MRVGGHPHRAVLRPANGRHLHAIRRTVRFGTSASRSGLPDELDAPAGTRASLSNETGEPLTRRLYDEIAAFHKIDRLVKPITAVPGSWNPRSWKGLANPMR